jgi:tRNA threonylcarbamoyladenosine biosynthesis protein TsaB
VTCTFLVSQSNYTGIEIALFKDERRLAFVSETKFNATKNFTLLIDYLFEQGQITLKDLDFIAANRGPGPFTTLRTVITTMNGIAFATGLPIVGVNGLEAFSHEYKTQEWPCTVYLLNAFSNQLYYAIEQHSQVKTIGCASLPEILTLLTAHYATKEPIRFLGNGAILYRTHIQEQLGTAAYIPDIVPEMPSVKAIADSARRLWQQKEAVTQLVPLYLRDNF